MNGYFDHNATTSLHPAAREAWLLASEKHWHNPSSLYRDAGIASQRLESARERLGVELQAGDELRTIAGLLDDLSLVALAFPAFSDGRSFSKAELLRSRHGFKGAVRATGEVLVDQLPHMLRLGFDEFEIKHPVLLRRLEAGQVGGLGFYYQPTGSPERSGAGYSWRRRPR